MGQTHEREEGVSEGEGAGQMFLYEEDWNQPV